MPCRARPRRWPSDEEAVRASQAAHDLEPNGKRIEPRRPTPMAAFAPLIRERNAELQQQEAKPLLDVEFFAARLYTGPAFMKYNAVLRGVHPSSPTKLRHDFRRRDRASLSSPSLMSLSPPSHLALSSPYLISLSYFPLSSPFLIILPSPSHLPLLSLCFAPTPSASAARTRTPRPSTSSTRPSSSYRSSPSPKRFYRGVSIAIGCHWLPLVAIGCHWLPLVAIGCH